MYKKLKKFHDWEDSHFFRIYGIIFLIICIISTIYSMKIDYWSQHFQYPPQELQNLETEATRIISEEAFNSKYDLITTYNSKTKLLKLDLTDDYFNVIVEIKDYKTNNTKPTTTKRSPGKLMYFLIQIFIYFGMQLVLTIALMIIFEGISYLFLFISFIFYNIFYKKNTSCDKFPLA